MDTIGVIPASPGQVVIRIWVDTDDMTPIVERWPVIAWRILDHWAEPICTHPRAEFEVEFFVQPDGRLANLDGEGFFDDVCEAVANCIAVSRSLADMRAKA